MTHHLDSSRRRPLRRAAIVAGVLLALTAGLGGVPGAAARSVQVSDPATSPAAVDITRVTYADRETVATTVVQVRHLGPVGTLVVQIAPQDADVIYNATVTRTADGKVTKKLEYTTDVDSTEKNCAYDVSWNLANSAIRVTVPQSCLKFGGFLSKHWMAAALRVPGAADAAKPANLGRGDSPGCVTKTEWVHVRRGQLIGQVQASLDTGGRFGHGGAGGYDRFYKKCVGRGIYSIEYDGVAGRVLAKFAPKP